MEPMHLHSIGKVVAWSLVVVIFSVFFFMVLQQAFTASIFSGDADIIEFLNRVILPIIIFSAFLGAFGMHAMMVESVWYRTGTTVLVSIAPFLFFTPTLWSFVAVIGFFIVLTIFHETIRGDMRSRIKVQPLYTLAAGLSTVVIALLVPICLLFYSTYQTRPYALEELRNTIRDSIVTVSLATASSQIDGFTPDATLDQVIANVLAGKVKLDVFPFLEGSVEGSEEDERIQSLKQAIEAQTGKALSDEELEQLEGATKAEQDAFAEVVTEQLGAAEQQLIAEVRNELIKSMNIEAEGTDTIKEVFTKFVDRKVIGIVEPYLKFAPIIFTVSLFFILYIFSFLFKYLTRLFGLLWYWILRVSHFIFIKEKDVKAQFIALDNGK